MNVQLSEEMALQEDELEAWLFSHSIEERATYLSSQGLVLLFRAAHGFRLFQKIGWSGSAKFRWNALSLATMSMS